jgi:AraC-like DNA-binding protein
VAYVVSTGEQQACRAFHHSQRIELRFIVYTLFDCRLSHPDLSPSIAIAPKMRIWKITSDSKIGSYGHRIADGKGHALLAQVVGGIFHVLRVSASLWEDGYWWSLHSVPNVTSFESEHGVETERQAYNERMFATVRQEKRPVRGEHAGYHDWFVPVEIAQQAAAILVVGPFALERATGAAIFDRWKNLTGRRGDLADPEFALYLNRTVSTLVLEGDAASKLERLLRCLASLLAEKGRADELANRADALRVGLESIRRVDRTWEAVQAMVDERSPRTWASAHNADALGTLGLPRIADHIAVGLGASRAGSSDSVDAVLRSDAFQRKAVQLARSVGGAMTGRLEDRGIILLSTGSGSSESKRQKSLGLLERLRVLARREFDIVLHFGVSDAPGAVPLNRSYQGALSAAESALVQGAKVMMAEPEGQRSVRPLRSMRREITRAMGERPDVLLARFDRYLEAVLAQSGDRIETARAHLDAGFERMGEALVQAGSLEERGFDRLSDALERAAVGARSVRDLLSAYRQSAIDLSDAVERPVQSRQDRSLRGALDYIHQHYTERLYFQKVARVSGFAPKYFSRLFKERQKRTYEHYVLGLRIERGKHLLSSTNFDVARVAKLSGFSSSQYFCYMFRREVGKSPLQFRRLRVYPSWRPGDDRPA